MVHEIAIVCLIHTEEINISPTAGASMEEPQTADNMSLWYSKTVALLNVIFKAILG